MNGLNENIKRFRKLLNYTQAEMALKVGCTTAAYCKYERGIVDIPSRILIRIADVFHISLDEITDRGVFAKETIKEEYYIAEGLKFIDRRKELWPVADECNDQQILSYVKLYNEYRDCFVADTIYNAISYFSNKLCTSKLLDIFHASATGYRKYSTNGNLVKKRNSIIAKDIERIIDKSPLEITEILKEKYPSISHARVKRIIYDFDLRPIVEKQKVKNGVWLLDYASFDGVDIYIIEEPESGYILGLGYTASEAYNNALDKSSALMNLKGEPGYMTGRSKFFSCLNIEYLQGEKPSRFLISRYMYFYNHIRIDKTTPFDNLKID